MRRILHRPAHANKYDFGHVLILGGSAGMVGAPLLAAKAALRIGAGLVTIVSDQATAEKLDKRVEEVMTLGLPTYDEHQLEALLAFMTARKVTVVIIGPGLRPETASFVRRLAAQVSVPLVLDADGLSAFYHHLPALQDLAHHNPQIILTPHGGEFARLTSSAQAKDGTSFAHQHQLTLVLKGDHTQVLHPDGSSWTNNTGNPGLATAGTGDVLDGVIGGLLAQGASCNEAAELGVYLHGLAGDLAAAAKTQPGMIASDVIDYLPAALKQGEV